MEPVESTIEDKSPKAFKNITLEKVKPDSEFKNVESNGTIEGAEYTEGAIVNQGKDQIRQIVKEEENRLEAEKKMKKD